MPVPEYSIVPHVSGRTYTRGEVAFDPVSGECYQVVAASTDDPISLPDWRWIPFLQKWSTFVVQGAFADCFGEFDQGGNEDIQAKLGLAGRAEAKAMQALEARIDELTSQGQVLKYNVCDRSGCNGWCESVAFTGGAVTTLTSECQDELGWVYPPHPEIMFSASEDISGLTAILNGLNYVDVTFTEAMANSRWLLVEAHVINTVDASSLSLETGTMLIKTASGFRVALNGAANTDNYRLAWIVRPEIAVPIPEEATTYLLSGPSMG
jgi:hypothetical protein